MAVDTAPMIGARLKDARRARLLTLDDVAAACGVTKGYLSKVERDVVNPSVATLVRICSVLGIEIGALFEDAPAGRLVRAGSLPRIAFGGENMIEYLLTPSDEKRIQVLLSRIEPGGGSGAESYSLPVDVNFVHVLDGTLSLHFDSEAVQLSEGDAYTFSPRTPHSFLAGTGGARVLWVLNPALPEHIAKAGG